MSDAGNETAKNWYGEHATPFMIGSALVCAVGGAAGFAWFTYPDHSILSASFMGGMMGFWSWFCVMAWRMLFNLTDDAED